MLGAIGILSNKPFKESYMTFSIIDEYIKHWQDLSSFAIGEDDPVKERYVLNCVTDQLGINDREFVKFPDCKIMDFYSIDKSKHRVIVKIFKTSYLFKELKQGGGLGAEGALINAEQVNALRDCRLGIRSLDEMYISRSIFHRAIVIYVDRGDNIMFTDGYKMLDRIALRKIKPRYGEASVRRLDHVCSKYVFYYKYKWFEKCLVTV